MKSQWTVLVEYLTISITNVSCYQTRCRWQYYLPFSNTAHGARNAVQQLLCKTLNFISPELWPQQARAEFNWLQDLKSIQQREYELEVNKIKEFKQRLIEPWKGSNTTLSEKMRFSCFCVLPGSAVALLSWGGKINNNLTAYSVGNILAKKIPKSVDVRQSYSKPKQCRFLRRSVFPSLFGADKDGEGDEMKIVR